ncbi:MAG TPA: GAF domain-containing sensor histidine kinase [Solirubrobacteraceae bacterium]|nr:GAF domain-containing sensor histidine kinase [Solirubrobacteraceae bacterium]
MEAGQLAVLVEEHAVLRRVATLVAQGAPPAEIFEAVIAEVGELISADGAAVSRYEGDGTLTAIGAWSRVDGYFAVGTRHAVAPGTLARLILDSGRPGRIDSYENVAGSLAHFLRGLGWRSSVGSPIIVGGGLWGVVGVASTADRPLPDHTERRLAQFTELVGTAIANAQSREELAASRARLVAAADASRRRIERDLHDGAQQRLVSLALELRKVQAAVPAELGDLQADLSRIVGGLTNVLEDLREIAHGIHPAMLAEGGLGPALKTLARRSAIPVELDLRVPDRLPEAVEVAAYYVVSEALTNAAKHARASVVEVTVATQDRALHLSVRDDGIGGADAARGYGLVGLKDRAEAIGGTMSIESPHDGGTLMHIELPLDGRLDGGGGRPEGGRRGVKTTGFKG